MFILDFIATIISSIIIFVADTAGVFWQHLNLAEYSFLQIFIDILLVAIIFYWIIMLIKGTRAAHIITGLSIVASVFLLSQILNLYALDWILDKLLTVILVAIPIIFQQELRRGLEKLGQTKLSLRETSQEIDYMINNIVEACNEMTKRKIGALIVFRAEDSLKEYLDTGVEINGKITKELLLNIFHSQTPLHDGAVIIENKIIKAAGCILPHSFKIYRHDFGVRHKCALALSEQTDAKIIVVSEERKTISFVENGEIHKDISPEQLRLFLEKFLKPKPARKRRLNF